MNVKDWSKRHLTSQPHQIHSTCLLVTTSWLSKLDKVSFFLVLGIGVLSQNWSQRLNDFSLLLLEELLKQRF